MNKETMLLIGLAMTQKRLGVRDLSKVTGINEGNLSKYVNGKKPIGLKIAYAIAAALDLSPFDLVELSAKEIKQIQEIKNRAAKFAA